MGVLPDIIDLATKNTQTTEGIKMRGYVERMEMLAAEMPEGQEPTYEDVMDTYYDDVDRARDARDDNNE